MHFIYVLYLKFLRFIKKGLDNLIGFLVGLSGDVKFHIEDTASKAQHNVYRKHTKAIDSVNALKEQALELANKAEEVAVKASAKADTIMDKRTTQIEGLKA